VDAQTTRTRSGSLKGGPGMPSWLRIAGVAVGAVAIVLVFNLAVFLLFAMPPLAGMAWVAAVGGVFLWWHARRRPDGRPSALARRIRLRRPRVPAWWIAGTVGATVVGMLGVARFVELAAGPLDLTDSPFYRDILAYTETLPGWLAFAFAAAVVVPIIEEFAFRGRLQRAMEWEWGNPAVAVVATAAVFALVHVGGPHPFLLVVPFLVGIACGVVVILSRSIWPAVILHGVWNGLMSSLALADRWVDEVPAETGTGLLIPVAALMVLVGGAWWAYLIRRWRSELAPKGGASSAFE